MPLTVSKLDGLKCRFEFFSPSAMRNELLAVFIFLKIFHSQKQWGQKHAMIQLNMEFSYYIS